MSLRRSCSPPSSRRGLGLVLGRSRSNVDNCLSSPTRSPKPLLPFCTSPSHLEEITLDFDPSEISPFSDSQTFGACNMGSNSMTGRTAKEYEEKLRELSKENFNLKLRIYFLEERMSKFARPGLVDDEDAERKIIELKVELEGLKRELKSKQILLAQASKAIELMEEQHASKLRSLEEHHSAEIRALKLELDDLKFRVPANKNVSQVQKQLNPLDNSMQLYLDAFDMRPSMFMPPPPAPSAKGGECGKEQSARQEQMEALIAQQEQQMADMSQQLQNCMAELEATKERELNLAEVLDSKEPNIQIKIQELNEKDAMLAEQRKIIVEIEIKLDEKQRQLESLRQQLEATQATVIRHEAEQTALQERLRESEEKRNKSCSVIQSLMTKTKQLTSELREAKERKNKAEWEARQNPPDEIGEMTSDETERLWAELDQQRRQVERLVKDITSLQKEKAASEQSLRQELADARLQLDRAGRTSSVFPDTSNTVKHMLGRLDELASFLSALLRRPHLLSSLSPAHRTGLLQAVQDSWGSTKRRFSLSLSLTMQQDKSILSETSYLPEDASLIGQIQAFLNDDDSMELLSEVEAERERSAEMWPVSMTSVLDAGKELIVWDTPQHVREEEEEEGEGGGATAVEREPPGNQSESEAWSEPDLSVSFARIGLTLPGSCTPVVQTDRSLVSPASSEADLITRTPGKRASARRLANRLRDSEQINDALKAELKAYKVMVKHSSPHPSPHNSKHEIGLTFPASSMLQEMENQRSRLESLLKHNEVIRQQLENARLHSASPSKIDDFVHLQEVQRNLEASKSHVTQLEVELTSTSERCKALEAKLEDKENLHQKALTEAQDALSVLQSRETELQHEAEQARDLCLKLEKQVEISSERCRQLELAALHDSERHDELANQLQEAQTERDKCLEQISHYEQLEAQKPVLVDSSVQANSQLIVDTSVGNSTGPSSLINLSDCDDVFHNEGSSGSVEQTLPVPDSPQERHALSSPDLGIESDTGRMSSLGGPPGEHENSSKDEISRLKYRLAKSQELLDVCLTTLRQKNENRKLVEASVKKQLKRTEEVLTLSKNNLRSITHTSHDQQ